MFGVQDRRCPIQVHGNPGVEQCFVVRALSVIDQLLITDLRDSVTDELRRTRVRWATTRLEAGYASSGLEDLATATGFGTVARMRRAFARQIGVSPLEYRETVQGVPT
jgi:transcriptional regulator GlxA family with amidase domain